MQTSDLNINNTESDHANAIFRQFQDAIFSREHTPVKTLTKIIFDLLQWQKIATLSLRKKSCHPFFHLNNTSREGGAEIFFGARFYFFSSLVCKNFFTDKFLLHEICFMVLSHPPVSGYS